MYTVSGSGFAGAGPSLNSIGLGVLGMVAIMSDSKRSEDFTPEEAQRRFESAVDAALRTPPMHKVAGKKPEKKTAKPKAKKA